MKKIVIIIITAPIVFFIVFAFAASFLTNRYIEQKIKTIKLESESNDSGVFTYDRIQNLPENVKNYFQYAIKEGAKIPKSLLIEQKALFKTDESSPYKNLYAEQLFNTQKPEFIWNASINLMPLIWVKGIDSYINGKGNMLIKFLSSVTITDAKGKEIDQGALLRYVLESAWFPTFLALNKNANWKELSDSTAELSLIENGILMNIIFYFNKEHQIIKSKTERYRTTNSGYVLTPYTGYYSNYKLIDNFMVPTHVEVEWNLPTKNLLYGKFDITKVKYSY
ncbi:DUF6544 family protein [Melioribacteraceae bacterium 4301-Me]|uniref:DUF6920 family protein n=1 Tax=Pyranulibacter aquaticus TaxID=3163344 RepID=UPI0035997F43